MLYSVEHEVFYAFIRGLALPLYFASKNLIEVVSYFPLVANQVRAIDRECIRTYTVGIKMP